MECYDPYSVLSEEAIQKMRKGEVGGDPDSVPALPVNAPFDLKKGSDGKKERILNLSLVGVMGIIPILESD